MPILLQTYLLRLCCAAFSMPKERGLWSMSCSAAAAIHTDRHPILLIMALCYRQLKLSLALRSNTSQMLIHHGLIARS